MTINLTACRKISFILLYMFLCIFKLVPYFVKIIHLSLAFCISIEKYFSFITMSMAICGYAVFLTVSLRIKEIGGY